MKIFYTKLLDILEEILVTHGFSKKDAKLCAEIFSENTLVGVISHGVNRFAHFIELVKSKHVNPQAKPTLENSFNAFEQWNGNRGPGPLNAQSISEKVIKLAEKFGIGCIALKNTNHWMRPGYYAGRAAQKGFIFICFTNTIPNMPPWGAKQATTGNNPIVLAIPRKRGNIVLDMALSQYSYGSLANYSRANAPLPYPGGYDSNNNLTTNAKDIYEAQRPLPIGYWKGAGLSLLLDLISTILSAGKSTYDLSKSIVDSGMSQVYIAIEPGKLHSSDIIEKSINEILEYYLSAEAQEGQKLSYPGERIAKTREKNLKEGIPINEQVWQKIINLRSTK